MKTIEVTGTVANIPAGTLMRLDAGQARRRAHALEKTDVDGVWRAKTALQFKRGEKLGIELPGAAIPKTMAGEIAEAADEGAERPARRR